MLLLQPWWCGYSWGRADTGYSDPLCDILQWDTECRAQQGTVSPGHQDTSLKRYMHPLIHTLQLYSQNHDLHSNKLFAEKQDSFDLTFPEKYFHAEMHGLSLMFDQTVDKFLFFFKFDQSPNYYKS